MTYTYQPCALYPNIAGYHDELYHRNDLPITTVDGNLSIEYATNSGHLPNAMANLKYALMQHYGYQDNYRERVLRAEYSLEEEVVRIYYRQHIINEVSAPLEHGITPENYLRAFTSMEPLWKRKGNQEHWIPSLWLDEKQYNQLIQKLRSTTSTVAPYLTNLIVDYWKKEDKWTSAIENILRSSENEDVHTILNTYAEERAQRPISVNYEYTILEQYKNIQYHTDLHERRMYEQDIVHFIQPSKIQNETDEHIQHEIDKLLSAILE